MAIRPRHLVLGALAALTLGAAPAAADVESLPTSFTTSDGVTIHGTLTGQAPITARPTVVEFSPYGEASGTFDPGPDFNNLVIEDRGTGRSTGSFDALGPLAQRDVSETLAWACRQPWSDGNLGLNGFSASAIMVYNSLHLPLPCVRAATLRSGTFELYRDLMFPGGINNIVPAIYVIGAISAGTMKSGFSRDPGATPDAFSGMFQAGIDGSQRDTLDDWWQARGFRGDVNDIPILMVDGFYDVESRGAFEAFQELRGDGAHLYLVNGHDPAPSGTDAGVGEMHDWFDHYLRAVDNGVDRRPAVQMLLSRGDRSNYASGTFVRRDAADWPVPGTRWQPFYLDAARSGTARSSNDGSLTAAPNATASTASYPAVLSNPGETDVPNSGFANVPPMNDVTSEPGSLTFTSAPFDHDVVSAGPADLDLQLSTTTPGSAIWATICDVWPDGTVHPLTTGRLSTDFPGIDASRSRYDAGALIQPYGDFSVRTPATPAQTRAYHVEFWPLGNVFAAGHRIRLQISGSSAVSKPAAPAVHTVTLGGTEPSRLMVPVTPAQP